jgi:hypothetical protein
VLPWDGLSMGEQGNRMLSQMNDKQIESVFQMAKNIVIHEKAKPIEGWILGKDSINNGMTEKEFFSHAKRVF